MAVAMARALAAPAAAGAIVTVALARAGAVDPAEHVGIAGRAPASLQPAKAQPQMHTSQLSYRAGSILYQTLRRTFPIRKIAKAMTAMTRKMPTAIPAWKMSP